MSWWVCGADWDTLISNRKPGSPIQESNWQEKNLRRPDLPSLQVEPALNPTHCKFFPAQSYGGAPWITMAAAGFSRGDSPVLSCLPWIPATWGSEGAELARVLGERTQVWAVLNASGSYRRWFERRLARLAFIESSVQGHMGLCT